MGSPGGFSESLPVERSGCQPMLSAARTGVGLGGACSRGVGGAHSPAGGRGAQMGSCDPGQLGVEWARGPDGQSSLRSPSGDDRQHSCPSEGSLDPAPRRGSPVLMQPPRAMSPRTWRQNRSLWWGQLTPGPSRGGAGGWHSWGNTGEFNEGVTYRRGWHQGTSAPRLETGVPLIGPGQRLSMGHLWVQQTQADLGGQRRGHRGARHTQALGLDSSGAPTLSAP